MKLFRRIKEWFWRQEGWVKLDCGCWAGDGVRMMLTWPCQHEQDRFHREFGISWTEYIRRDRPDKPKDDDSPYWAPFIG